MSTDTAPVDPILQALEQAIYAFVLVKRRYPLLLATAAEMDRLRQRPDVRPTPNDAVIQIMRDSFDMLVIDLYSIRERVSRDLFEMLKDQPRRLAPKTSTASDPWLASFVESNVRAVATNLLGTESPTADDVKAVCRRFRTETEPLDADRNRVRAHRYQQDRDTSSLFIVLPELQGQINVVQRYLEGLYLLVTNNSFSMEMTFEAGTEDVAKDLADIISHGSINETASYYGMARATAATATAVSSAPWYWLAREETLKGPLGPSNE